MGEMWNLGEFSARGTLAFERARIREWVRVSGRKGNFMKLYI